MDDYRINTELKRVSNGLFLSIRSETSVHYGLFDTFFMPNPSLSSMSASQLGE